MAEKSTVPAPNILEILGAGGTVLNRRMNDVHLSNVV
jgi:hypothetical protein